VEASIRQESSLRTIAITSGKGGVGKTNIAANLSIALTQAGQRVVVFDADIGLANLDVVLGCRVSSTLQEVVGGHKTLREVMHFGPLGLSFIPGGSGLESLFTLTDHQSERLLKEFGALANDFDILVIDTGAGLSENVTSFVRAADEVLIIVTPDPSSLTDGYATAKALFQDRISMPVKLLVNMVSGEPEAEQVYKHLNGVVQRFLGHELGYAGYVRTDPVAIGFIRKRVPFYTGNPNSAASVDVARIAHQLLGKTPPASGNGDWVSKLRGLFHVTSRRTA